MKSHQELFNFALKTFLLLSPLFFLGNYYPSFIRGLFFIFFTFLLFAISLSLRPKRRFSNQWVSLFLLLALIRAVIGGDFGSGAQEWFNFWISFANFIYVFSGVLLLYVVYCYTEDPRKYLTPVLTVCILNLVLVIAQLTGNDFMWSRAPSISGFFGISSQLGQYSAMSLPVAVFINPWLGIIPLTLLYVSGSISSIMAVSGGLIFWGWQSRKWAVLFFLLIPLSLGCFNYELVKRKWVSRPTTWKKTIRKALERPYIGWGYGSFTKVVVQSEAVGSIGDREFTRAHNDFLHTSQELGVPIVVVIGSFFVGLWKRFRAKLNKDKFTYLLATSVVVGLINMSGQTVARYASVMSLFIVLLAFLMIQLEGEENGNPI